MNDKQRSDQPKKFENNTCTELQVLLENSAQTLQELSAALNITPLFSKCLYERDSKGRKIGTVKETLMQFKWEVLPHPVYSPDLVPSDYYLFRCSTT